MRRRVVVRIVGFVCTRDGFAYAVSEGPQRLVKWSLVGIPDASSERVARAIIEVLVSARPLFVALDTHHNNRKRVRGLQFAKALKAVCLKLGIMLLDSGRMGALVWPEKATNWKVASEIASRFPEIAEQLPAERKAWQTENERISLFLALATAVRSWESFRSPDNRH